MNFNFEYVHKGNLFLIDVDIEKLSQLHFPVFSITLVQGNKNKDFNLLHLSNFVGQRILEVFAESDDSVIFYISDTSDVLMGKSKKIAPQEFRHNLFKKMIILSKVNISYSELIINEKTYLSTISLLGNEINQRLVETEIKNLADK